ncbi:hypothetical protein IJT17_07650 [bacterium]|nr:hypothetical protein [bacterium]
MKKKATFLAAIIAICGGLGLGAGWPTGQKQNPNQITATQVTPDSPRLARNLWHERCFMALIDKHLDTFVTLLSLPPGWIANGSVWNHHTMMVRSLGLINRDGASAFVLVGTEDKLEKPISAIGEADVQEINKAWEQLIATLYPKAVIDTDENQQLLTWHELSPSVTEVLEQRKNVFKDAKRGRYIKLFELTTPQGKLINVALVCDFDLFETRIADKPVTIMRNRHVKLCFVPDGLDFNGTVKDVHEIARQTERVYTGWETELAEHTKKDQECHLPEGRIYSVNSMSNELRNMLANPYTIGTNTFTGERVLIPTAGCSCWVSNRGTYMYVSNGNPNDIEPLQNKNEWRRLR